LKPGSEKEQPKNEQARKYMALGEEMHSKDQLDDALK
jgi:hypothetical protein